MTTMLTVSRNQGAAAATPRKALAVLSRASLCIGSLFGCQWELATSDVHGGSRGAGGSVTAPGVAI
jgi:hypothetical protein